MIESLKYSFPANGLLPKDVTGVTEFIEKYGLDGKGVTVAVIDSGVDPGAEGLTRTSDGKQKIVDVIDCTGSGDVHMSPERLCVDGKLLGLSGRTLRVPERILSMCPSKKFRVGLKTARSFWPEEALRKRATQERELVWEKEWRKQHAHIKAELEELEKQDEARQNSTDAERLHENVPKGKKEETKGTEEKETPNLRRDDLYKCSEYLSHLHGEWNDPGPVFDCLTFYDGAKWRAIVDTTETGNLEQATVLENYRDGYQLQRFSDYDNLNFSVNVYDKGELLSIVVSTDDHATHVAGVVGAYYPDRKELNGLAPGCQVVSLKAVDPRTGSLTHQGNLRALASMMKEQEEEEGTEGARHKVKVDIVTMSWGGSARESETGRFMDLARELVTEHKVLFFNSIGNEGPSISTVGAPGGVSDLIIGVGAYVTRDMIKQLYSSVEFPRSDWDSQDSRNVAQPYVDQHTYNGVKEKHCDESKGPDPVDAAPYTFSSRGPSLFGHLGVSICAPGGALSPVPRWKTRSKRVMHGTSMACPSVAGAVAVLISFLRSKKIQYSTASVQTALENTARRLAPSQFSETGLGTRPKKSLAELEEPDSVFAAGRGSIYIPDAAKYLESSWSRPLSLQGRMRAPTRLDPFGDSTSWGEAGSKTPDLKYLPKFHLEMMRICVETELRHANGKYFSERGNGIYIRRSDLWVRSRSATVHGRVWLKPSFDLYADSPEEAEALTLLEVPLLLETDCKWLSCPREITLVGADNHFPVAVDLYALQSGSASYSEVQGFVQDSRGKRRGPLFRVPVTIILGEEKMSTISKLHLNAGRVWRKFINPPFGATYCTLKIVAASNYGYDKMMIDSRDLMLQSLQVEEKKHFYQHFERAEFSLRPGEQYTKTIPVINGTLLEICIAQQWDSFGDCILESVDYSFGGLSLSSDSLHALPGEGFESLAIANQLQGEVGTKGEKCFLQRMRVFGFFDTVLHRERPVQHWIELLGFRDSYPRNRRTYMLKLMYEFRVPSEVFKYSDNPGGAAEVSLNYPGFFNDSFDSMVEGPFFMLFDESKSPLYTAECDRWLIAGGKYALFSYIRGEGPNFLKNFSNLALTIQFHLSQKLPARAYSTQQGAFLGIGKNGVYKRYLELGKRANLWFQSHDSDFNGLLRTGDTFKGLFVIDDHSDHPEDTEEYRSDTEDKELYYETMQRDLKRYTISFDFISKKNIGGSAESAGASPTRNKTHSNESFMDGYNLLSAEWLADVKRREAIRFLRDFQGRKSWSRFDKLFEKITADTLSVEEKLSLNMLLLRLRRQDEEMVSLKNILSAADPLCTLREKQIECNLLHSAPPGNNHEDILSLRAEQKYCLVEALFRACRAILTFKTSFGMEVKEEMEDLGGGREIKENLDTSDNALSEWEDESSSFKDKFQELWNTLEGYMSTNERAENLEIVESERLGPFSWDDLQVLYEVSRRQYGKALTLLKSRERDKKAAIMRIAILKRLGWEFEKNLEVRRKLIKFPRDFERY